MGNINKKLLVCGGLPRSATTFLHNELCNYENVYRSIIKETYLFKRNYSFIDVKINLLKSNRIYLDFTPEYIFDNSAIKKIREKGVDCFFIIRDFASWKMSLSRYLSINKINNKFLECVTEDDFAKSIERVRNNFLTFTFEEVAHNTEKVIITLEKEFQLDFGKKISFRINKNSSENRIYYCRNVVHNVLPSVEKIIRSTLFGII